jgi:hypothetical protein
MRAGVGGELAQLLESFEQFIIFSRARCDSRLRCHVSRHVDVQDYKNFVPSRLSCRGRTLSCLSSGLDRLRFKTLYIFPNLRPFSPLILSITLDVFSAERLKSPTLRLRVSSVRRLFLAPAHPPWVTGGFLYKLGGGSYTIRILMYPACILHVSCMYSSRYIKIHRDTTRYICICHFGHQKKMYLT